MFSKRKSYHLLKKEKGRMTLCTLEVGSTFGETVLEDLPRECAVVTKTACELLRLQPQDIRAISEKNKEIMNDLLTNCKIKSGLSNVQREERHVVNSTKEPGSCPSDSVNPALPITEVASKEMTQACWVLRILLLNEREPVLRERRTAGGRLVIPCATSGSELVTWLMGIDPRLDRTRATWAWQALLEEGLLYHVAGEEPFKDKCCLYHFRADRDGTGRRIPTPQDIAEAEEHLQEVLRHLAARAPDAWIRMLFRKPSKERTPEDLEIIYDELLSMKALAQLTNSMKRELASVIVLECYPRAKTVVFEQGDVGKSWYVVVKGAVDVNIHGKGTVATLIPGEHFGHLALINNAPRAATIIIRDDNTHLLRVDKDDYDRILKDVEANTVRLKEHGKDVLILEKSPSSNSTNKYLVMACTPVRLVEYLLECRLESGSAVQDPAVDDFLLTHILYISIRQLVQELKKQYPFSSTWTYVLQ